MKKQKWTLGLVAIAAVAGQVINGQAQSVDSLLDKLVDKGVLSVKEANSLREEADKDFTKAYSAKSGMPEWVSALKFNGDIRTRGEWISPNNTHLNAGVPQASDRTRFRYRLRFGVTANLMDNLEAGFRLTSSEPAKGNTTGGDPISGNTTFSGNGSKKFVYFDQVYAKWTPLHTREWNASATVGKMENPFVFSDIVFDQDYTPEGASAQVRYSFTDRQSLKAIGGGFMLNEITGSSLDPYLLAAQTRLDSTWTSKLQSSLGLAILGIQNGQTPATSGLRSGDLPNQNAGNTRVAVGTDFAPRYNFHPIVADASVTYLLDAFPGYIGPCPVKVGGDYIRNSTAPSDRNSGWSTGVTLGKSGKKGLWDLSYRYKYLQSDAWFEELVDSDTGAFYNVAPTGGGAGYQAGTNVKGHVLKASYSPFDSTTLAVTWFMMETIDNPVPSAHGRANRLQVDASLKF